MPFRPLIRWGAAALVGASSLALLGACGGGEKDEGSSGAGAPGSADAAGAGQAGGAGVADICAVLDDAAVERLLGGPPAQPPTEQSVPGGTPLCSYLGPATSTSNMSVQHGTEEQLGVVRQMPEITPVSGVGDEAYERGGTETGAAMSVYTLTARTGDHWLQFSVYGGADRATVRSVMAEALASLA